MSRTRRKNPIAKLLPIFKNKLIPDKRSKALKKLQEKELQNAKQDGNNGDKD